MLMKNLGTPVRHGFPIPKTFGNIKNGPHEVFLKTRSFRKLFVIPSFLVLQTFLTQKWAEEETFRNITNFWKRLGGPILILARVRWRVMDNLWWYPHLVYRSFRGGPMTNLDFELSDCFSFCPYIFEEQNSHISWADFGLFLNLRKSPKSRVAGLLASCIVHFCSVTSNS